MARKISGHQVDAERIPHPMRSLAAQAIHLQLDLQSAEIQLGLPRRRPWLSSQDPFPHPRTKCAKLHQHVIQVRASTSGKITERISVDTGVATK